MRKVLHTAGVFGIVCLIACLSSIPVRVQAGVYDDCAAWWHFDFDANTNGLAETAEIRDQRDWGTINTPGASGKHATASYGPLGTPAWTNDVVSPAGGDTYGGRSMWFNPVTNTSGQVFQDTFKVGGLLLTNGNATIVTRFRWDGFVVNSSTPGWIYNNGLYWTDKVGWMFGVRDSNKLGMYVGQTAIFGGTVVTGKWYEAAAVLTDNGADDSVELYLWPEDGTLNYQKTTTSAVTNAAWASTGTIIGSEAYSSGYATGNALKSFKGAINHLAVWNRALTPNEVKEAFCHSQPLLKIGIDNNSSYDLGLEHEVGGDYFPNAPWHTMRRAVTPTTPTASVKIPLASYQSNLDYAVYVKTLTSDGLSGKLGLVVNSVTNPALTATNQKGLYWLVPASQLVTGTNTFTLYFASGPSSHIIFDTLEIAGAWQVGYEDNNQAEFVIESGASDDFYITDPNWLHLERAMTAGDNLINLHFALSPELESKYAFKYTTRVIQQGQGPHPFSIGINNKVVTNCPALPDTTYVTVPLARDDLKAGLNTIYLSFGDTNGWSQFDFHRLSVYEEAAKGTLIRMR